MDRRTAVFFGGIGVAAAAMIGVSVLAGSSNTGTEQASPAPSTSTLSNSVPTTTATPNEKTVEETLDEGLKAYNANIKTAKGAATTVFSSNNYAVQNKVAPNGDTESTPGAKTIKTVVQVGTKTYVQLDGAELERSAALREKAGKTQATWTTEIDKLEPTIIPWVYPADIQRAYRGLEPGLVLNDMFTQDDGSVVISADLMTDRIKSQKVRTAFSLPNGKTRILVQFNIDGTGVLNRIVVDVPKHVSQVVLEEFGEATVAAPPVSETITAADVEKATKPEPKKKN